MWIGPSKCKLCYFEPRCIPLGFPPLLPISKYTKCVYQANLVYSMSSWTKLHLNGLETILLIHVTKDQKTHLPHVSIKAFSILISFILLWSILLSCTLHQIYLISLIQFWSYIELLKLCISFKVRTLYQSYNDVSEYHLPITHTYKYIYEMELRLSLLFPVVHQGCQAKTCFSS